MTVRDFTMVFDAYTQFEESVLTAKMRMAEVNHLSFASVGFYCTNDVFLTPTSN